MVRQDTRVRLERDEFYACVSGLVGEVAVDLFLAYLKNSRTLGDIHAVMLDPRSSWQPPKKNDMLYAVVTAIAYWVQHGSDESDLQGCWMDSSESVSSFPRPLPLLQWSMSWKAVAETNWRTVALHTLK